MNNPENPPKMPSGGLIPDTPAAWFNNKFPGLSEKCGDPIDEEKNKQGKSVVRGFSEDFFATALGNKGCPADPAVYIPTEDRFFTYFPSDGIYIEQREQDLAAKISQLFLECARACREASDVKNLEFGFRDAASLGGIIKKAKSALAVPNNYFSEKSQQIIICSNGVLRLADKTLLPFSPEYRRRNRLNVNFDPAAKCPLFLDTLMHPALCPEKLDLLQRWCGLALVGINHAQKLIILTGTAGGGKGTFIRVLHGIIGSNNVGSLRTEQLAERFEMGRMLGKTLLYGPDVPENFLNCRGASKLKALTGGDPVSVELKGSNERPEIICRFNVIVTCNSRLKVHLEGDTDAWRRRLAIIEYGNSPPENQIADLSERILREEASGVLNWMLEGLEKLRADNWQLNMSPRQAKTVADLLLESDSQNVFVSECLEREGTEGLNVADCYEAYVDFAYQRGWASLPKNKFGPLICDAIVRKFAITQRNDIKDAAGKAQRGWKGVKLKAA
jgi:P4 family phage/plasmid primase-like protien